MKELKYLLPYVPYDIRVETKCGVTQVVDLDVKGNINTVYNVSGCKLLLRPMQSITTEETEELNSLLPDNVCVVIETDGNTYLEDADGDSYNGSTTYNFNAINVVYEWLFARHFDVFQLIKRGLAIEKK